MHDFHCAAVNNHGRSWLAHFLCLCLSCRYNSRNSLFWISDSVVYANMFCSCTYNHLLWRITDIPVDFFHLELKLGCRCFNRFIMCRLASHYVHIFENSVTQHTPSPLLRFVGQTTKGVPLLALSSVLSTGMLLVYVFILLFCNSVCCYLLILC